MNTNETLSGVTAGFIASIANSLSRNISEDRMRELIKAPEKMGKLLLPLADDCFALGLAPDIERIMIQQIQIVSLTLGASSGLPTMRKLMEEAYERKYAPLSQELAEKLCVLTVEIDEIEFTRIFPFVRNGDFWFTQNEFHPRRRSLAKILLPEDLDLVERHFVEPQVFFKQGKSDRSDCFKC